MAADSNMGFRNGAAMASAAFYNHHMVSFGSGAMSTQVGGGGGLGVVGGAVGMFNTGAGASSSSSSGVVIEPVLGRRRDARGAAADWTLEEQVKLQEGLVKFAGEYGIMKYIKIAALLRDKTVRDVALRCRWMTKKEHGKRHKQDLYFGKKLKDGKEKMLDIYSKTNVQMINSDMAAYSLMMNHVNANDPFSGEAPPLDGRTRNLMDENAQFISTIAANLATFKIQENIDLFCRTRNNITSILNSMSEMPGIMRLMPPLPVSVDEELLSTILRGTSQALQFGIPGGIYLKQEPRC